MASIIYNSFLDDVVRGNVNPSTDTFKVMVVGAAYTENKDTHTKRSDVTNEVTGTGYTAGGVAATVTVAKDTANDRITITLGGAAWASSTITNAQKFVYYKSRGGAASADELVAVIDNASPLSTTTGTLTLTASTLRIAN